MSTSSESDAVFFIEQMQDVRRLVTDRALVERPKNKALFKAARRAAEEQIHPVVDGLSDQFIVDVGPEDLLCWAADGVQRAQKKQLLAGTVPIQAYLDLHGMHRAQARTAVVAFLQNAQALSMRSVQIVHGKGLGTQGAAPLLKSYVYAWLQQHPAVLALASCAARHGGAGALYVLLRRAVIK